MTKDELLAQLTAGFPARRFTAGLLVAMIDFVEALGVGPLGIASYEALVARFPRQEVTSSGRRANTLIVSTGERTLSLRRFYDAAEALFRATHKRFDYPSCAPHATQAWRDYTHWIDGLASLTTTERAQLRNDVIEFVLRELPSQEFRPGSIEVSPAFFQRILDEFDFTAPTGEPSGAAYQGAVFGFIRADNPHLQVEIDKVRTGSKRLQRVGDIDAWDGERLAISAEVKHLLVTREYLPDLANFVNEANKRGAICLVVAEAMDAAAREGLQAQGAHPLGRDDLVQVVDLWDPAKQRIAVESMIYYVTHVEKNSVLQDRLRLFLQSLT